MLNAKYKKIIISFTIIICLLVTPLNAVALDQDEPTQNDPTNVAATQVTFTMNPNGGTLSGSTKITLTLGEKFGSLPTPKRTGYNFQGWTAANGKYVNSNTIVSSEHGNKLTAQWKIKTLTVKFDTQAGKVTSKKVIYGNPVGKLSKPKRSGFKFKAWYTKASGGTKISTKTVIKSDRTFYAQWKKNKYIIKFNANRGKLKKKAKTVYFSNSFGSLPKPTRKGYKFLGWHTKKKGGTKITSTKKYTYAKNVTLYARWGKISKFILYGNGGSPSKKYKTIVYSQKVGTLPTPTRKGYTFKGWYTAKKGGSKITPSLVVKYTKNQNLYAQWTANKYTVKFDPNGGTVDTASKKVTFNSKYSTLPTPTRENYIFKGWYTSGNKKVTSSTKVSTAANHTLTAKWGKFAIVQMLATRGTKCRPGIAMKSFKGVTIHNTGNTASTADATNHAKYLQGVGSSNSASWHYCVDESVATQSIPEGEVAWHAGNTTGNYNTIAIEICMNKGGDLTMATDNGAMLAADILAAQGITKAESGKNLFQHNYWSGKNCPEMIRKGKPYNWTAFVEKVNYYLENY